MRMILLCPLVVVAACAAPSAKDLEKQPPAEVCYMGMTQPENKQMADAEIQRRKINCQDYAAEMQKMQDMERRAGTSGDTGTGQAARPSGGMGRY
ncbi:MAG: hypothetical protein E6H57_22010 [Betaproteobacteria bacterium]|nr:MAG: hypothetical protein E6H57_22010 [Betaproteobacteria bacterium]